ncbi:hypothetical protein [Polaribacter sp. Asnod1-A03]|uniref:hypothetical protein n=1 Tax=Polaribacter sp. Asnod1-A03 TaxID=3160581 RepID=UPI0038645E3B
MNFFQKIKAGALQYVLVISVVIAIIIFAFISLVYLQQRMNIKYQFTKDAINNVQMGFDIFKQKKITYNTETPINFSDNTETVTTLIKKHWGIFDLAIVNSKVKNEFFQKVGLLGFQSSKRDALFLQDNNNALVLVGKTKIIGDASLPKRGVKSGNIAGESYYGNELIYGTIKASTSSLPKIKNIKYVKDFYKNYQSSGMESFELEIGLKLYQSFTENTLIYESINSIVLEDISLRGNIIIVSKTAITIKPSAILEDVIIMAPRINIEKNTTGNFQAFANKLIKVEANCTLNYPSALILLEDENQSSTSNSNNQQLKPIDDVPIAIAENSEIKGFVIYHSEIKTLNYKAQIQIEASVLIKGEVYCSKNLELQGTVFGTVYTNNFLVKKSGRIYINSLYNGVINSKEIPIQYAGLLINDSNSVAKWMN